MAPRSASVAAAPARSRASVRRRSVSWSSAAWLATAIAAAGSAPAGPGRTSTKLEPTPGTLAASSSPPIARARSRAIGRPRPVPVIALVIGHAVEALEDPLAVRRRDARSFVADRDHRDRTLEPTRELDRRGRRANLIALAARLVTICSTRRRSPVADAEPGRRASRAGRTPRSSAIGSSPADDGVEGIGDRERLLLQHDRPGLESARAPGGRRRARPSSRRSCARAP